MTAADAVVIIEGHDISDVCYLRGSIDYSGGTKVSSVTYPLADKMNGGQYRYEGKEPTAYEFEIKTTTKADFLEAVAIVENALPGAVCQVGRSDEWFELHSSSVVLETPVLGVNFFYRAKCKLYAKRPYSYSTTIQYLDVPSTSYGEWEDFTNSGHRDTPPRYLSAIGGYASSYHTNNLSLDCYMTDHATSVGTVLLCDRLNTYEELEVDFADRKIAQTYVDDYVVFGSTLWTQDKSDGALGTWSSGKISLTATNSSTPAWYSYYFPGPWILSKPIELTTTLTVTGNADNAHLYYQSRSDMRFIDIETIESGVEKTYYAPLEGLEDVWIIFLSADNDVTLDVGGVVIKTERDISQSEIDKLLIPVGESRGFRITESDAGHSVDAYLEYEDRTWV